MALPSRSLIALILLAALAGAQSRPASRPAATRPTTRPIWMEEPDDRYVKMLAGKKLEDGKGFPGLVVVGESWSMAKTFGNGHENMEWPFWYFYEKGPWKLTICMSFPRPGIAGRIHAIMVAGEGAPSTSKGLKIGDPVAKASQLYGPPTEFPGALVGLDRKGRTVRTFTFGAGEGQHVVEDPPEFKDALFFPAAKLLVAVSGGKVLKLAIVEEEDTLPEFLQPSEKAPATANVKIDPSVKVPTVDPEKKLGFIVPPPPKLVDYKGAEFTAQVPVGWILADDTWTHPDSVESVTIRAMKGNRDESLEGAMFAMLLTSGAENLVPPVKRKLTSTFCRMVGATDGYCAVTVDKDKGNEGLPLRTYQILLSKGDRRYHLVVTRTQHPQRSETPEGGSQTTTFFGSPDGDALARSVMRSFRIIR